MADFSITKNRTQEGVSYSCDRRLYATRDGRLVEEGDPEAHELVCGAGGVINAKTAARLHLSEKGQKLPKAETVVRSTAADQPKEAEPVPAGAEIEREPGMGTGPAAQTVQKMSSGPGKPLGSGREK